MPTMAQLRRFLMAHPALVWALSFPLPPADDHLGFDADAAVPSARHLNRVLRELPSDLLHRLLDSQVRQVKQWRADEMIGETIAVDYFHHPDHDGFAAVPFCGKGRVTQRTFDAAGLPLCAAGLAMPCKFTYQDRTNAIIPYRRAKHVCPLF